MATEKIKPEGEKSAYVPNNKVHLKGYVNGVNFYDVEGSERKAINLLVTTQEYRGEGKEPVRTNHSVSLFTDNAEVIAKFEGIQADIEDRKAQKDVIGKKDVKSHVIELDGYMSNRKVEIGEGQYYNKLQIITKEDNISLGTKLGDMKQTNTAEITGNIASVDFPEKLNFAKIVVINDFTPSSEGAEKIKTPVEMRVGKNGLYSKHLFAALEKGVLGVGDLVHFKGALHNDNFESKDAKKVYKMIMDANSAKLIFKKGQKAGETEAAKAEVKQEVKPETKPRASRRSKNGVSM